MVLMLVFNGVDIGMSDVKMRLLGWWKLDVL